MHSNKRLTKDEFIRRSNAIHNGKYNYDKVVYVNNHTKVCIICPIHGEFWQKPSEHLNGHGCRACAGNKPLNTEDFIAKAKERHGERFDYSDVEYKGAHSDIVIKCNKCGAIIHTTPHKHLTCGGCVSCRIIGHTRTKELITVFA